MTDREQDLLDACPVCDSSRIRLTGHTTDTPKYQCRTCGSQFETPVERPRERDGNRVGLAGELDDMNPSDL